LVTHPENELILLCARTDIDGSTAERIRNLLQEELDWAHVIRAAISHGVMPLLYSSLRKTCPEAVPQPILAQLRERFDASAGRSLFLTSELLKLLKLLEAHEIRAIPFKGPILAALAYGKVTLRQFNDLDILVHRQDLQRAKDLLIAEGYRPGQEEAALLRHRYVYDLMREDGMVKVDLQWGITWLRYLSFPLDFEDLWERLEPASLAHTVIRTILPEDLLLFLSVHGSRHQWRRLEWICDIAEMVRSHPKMDWQRVMARADALRIRRRLTLGLLLSSDLLGAELPEQSVQVERPVQSLAMEVRNRLFADVPYGAIANLSFQLRALERRSDRAYYALYVASRAVTPNAEDRALLPLPAALSPLYYLLHPIRLTWAYGLRPLRRWRQGRVGR
jgi:hypothetical protein